MVITESYFYLKSMCEGYSDILSSTFYKKLNHLIKPLVAVSRSDNFSERCRQACMLAFNEMQKMQRVNRARTLDDEDVCDLNRLFHLIENLGIDIKNAQSVNLYNSEVRLHILDPRFPCYDAFGDYYALLKNAIPSWLSHNYQEAIITPEPEYKPFYC